MRWLALVLVLLSGCTIGVERRGDPRFLEKATPRDRGQTSTRDVAAAIGPPDELRQVGSELWFVYRYSETWRNSVVLNYYLNVFSWTNRKGRESTLIVAFDEQDRLLYTAIARGTEE